MKYIRFKNRGFVVFEETQSHAEFAKALDDEVISAGFVHATDWCDDGKLCCSGASNTLQKHVDPSDDEGIRRRFSR